MEQEAWEKEAEALFSARKFKKAIPLLRDVISKQPQNPKAFFYLGMAESYAQDIPNAKYHLSQAWKMNPNQPDAALQLGKICERDLNIGDAQIWFSRAKSIKENAEEARMHLNKIMRTFNSKHAPEKEEEKEESQEEINEDGLIMSLKPIDSDITFNDVIGLAKVKEYLTDNVILSIIVPELFKEHGKKRGLGMLLYGATGVGKTYLVKGLAGEATKEIHNYRQRIESQDPEKAKALPDKIQIIIANISQILSMYVGNSSKNMSMIFKIARKHAPCILFFDEIDALGASRSTSDKVGEGSAQTSTLNQFLQELDGLQADPEGLFVIGATNRPYDVDPALKRAGRLGDLVYIPPPTFKESIALIKFYLKNKKKGKINYRRLARAMAAYSPADIATVCDKAAMPSIKAKYYYGEDKLLTTADVLQALKEKDKSSQEGWYLDAKRELLGKMDYEVVDKKLISRWHSGSLQEGEKPIYKQLIKDIKKYTDRKKMIVRNHMRWVARHLW